VAGFPDKLLARNLHKSVCAFPADYTFKQKSIWIDLFALDRMVKMILIHSENQRASEDGQSIERNDSTDFGSTSETEPPNAPRTPLLPGVATDRRHTA
jgi:hypothetical protein